jgi:uncharacterized protein (TIGR02285 family)
VKTPTLCAALLCLSQAVLAAEAPIITVAWRDKPPYHYMDNGVAKGFLLQRAQAIFAAANIRTTFVIEPQKRIWADLSHGAKNYCSLSWYRLPGREAVSQYTLPLHIDPPHSVLISPNAVRQVKAHPTLASLMMDDEVTLGVVDGISYGPDLDAMIRVTRNQVMRRTVEATSMMRMLAIGRFSYMFVDREDWEYVRKQDPLLAKMVRYDFPDMPAGLKRYIVCSKDVAPEVMSRINAAITSTGGPSQSK